MKKADLNNLISSLSHAAHKVLNTCYDNPDGTGKKWELLAVQMDRTTLDYIIETLKEKERTKVV